MSGIVKTFPGARALDGASLTVGQGEVHAMVGQNGAGKSTLMKILNGAYRRDDGTVIFEGRSIDFASPQQAQRNGVGTVYQEINLVPFRSVAENIFMGREPRRFGFLNWSAMNRGAQRDSRTAQCAYRCPQTLNDVQRRSPADGRDCPSRFV